jgi:hypothetical protein
LLIVLLFPMLLVAAGTALAIRMIRVHETHDESSSL